MGRLVAQIPNEDPARLARVQDAKWRTIGVMLLVMLTQAMPFVCRPIATTRHASVLLSPLYVAMYRALIGYAGRLWCPAATSW